MGVAVTDDPDDADDADVYLVSQALAKGLSTRFLLWLDYTYRRVWSPGPMAERPVVLSANAYVRWCAIRDELVSRGVMPPSRGQGYRRELHLGARLERLVLRVRAWRDTPREFIT